LKHVQQGSISPTFSRAFFARVFLYVARKKAFVQKTRAKNARENVGEIDPRCGFYKYNDVESNLTFLALNTNLYYKTNNSGPDICGQLTWIRSELEQAVRDLRQVIILSHVPPGANFINILQAALMYERVLHSFSLITVWLCEKELQKSYS